MASIIEKAHIYSDKPFIAMPNAGYPYNLRGRQIYKGNPVVFAERMKTIVLLGVGLIG